jgi:hypothetical protein
MPATYESIATQTLGSATSTITFSSIPATFTDLVLVCNWANSSTASASRLRLNGDTGSNYSGTWIVGNGSSASSSRESSATSARIFGAAIGPASSYSNIGILQLQNYSNTTTNKTVLSRYGSAATDVQATVSLWRNTSAINSITIFDVLGQTYGVGATFTLYGIKAA